MSKSTKVDLVFLFFTAIWGLSFPLTKNVLGYTSIFAFLSLRFTSAAVILIIIFWKKLKLINTKIILYGSLIGLMFFGSLAFQVASLRFTTSSNSSFISALSVVIVPLVSAGYYKKKIDFSCILGVLFAVVGLFFISGGVNFKLNIGDLFSFLCAICITFQIIFIDIFCSKCDSALLSLIQVVFCAIFYNIVLFIIGTKPIVFNTQLTVSIFITGILGTAVAYTGIVFLEKFTSPTHTALIFCAEPVFATIFAMFIPNNNGSCESITINTFIGCGVILLSMVISELKIGNNIPQKIIKL
ncbi:permease [Clostridium acetobutylicum]|nr:permease [Clostridium acetobutylicum]